MLARKPGAFEHAKSVRHTNFPEELSAFPDALQARVGEDRRRTHRELLAARIVATTMAPLR